MRRKPVAEEFSRLDLSGVQPHLQSGLMISIRPRLALPVPSSADRPQHRQIALVDELDGEINCRVSAAGLPRV